jgi:uncharacterized membrane protein YfcA
MLYLLYILIGIVGGLIGGVFGVGGGILIVPALVLGLGFSQHLAQGTMMVIFLLPTSILGFWAYYKAGHTNIPAALLIAAGMVAGTALGSVYAQAIPGTTLKKMFGVLMIVGGLKLILWK